VAQNPPRLELFVDAIAGMSRVVASSLGPVALALGLVAGIVLVRRRARRAGAGAAGRAWSGLRVPVLAALSVPVGLAAVVRFTPDAEHLAQVEPFLIPVVAMGALVAGSGAAEVLRASRRAVRPGTSRGLLVPLAAAACSLAVVGSIAFHYPQCDRAGFHLPERYGRDLLASVPRGATLVVDGDNETFLAAHWIRQRFAIGAVAFSAMRTASPASRDPTGSSALAMSIWRRSRRAAKSGSPRPPRIWNVRASGSPRVVWRRARGRPLRARSRRGDPPRPGRAAARFSPGTRSGSIS